jgi:hypothetical protein
MSAADVPRLITAEEALARARSKRLAKVELDATARLHHFVRNALPNVSEKALQVAIADRLFLGGAGHMQTALSAAIAVGRSHTEQQGVAA